MKPYIVGKTMLGVIIVIIITQLIISLINHYFEKKETKANVNVFDEEGNLNTKELTNEEVNTLIDEKEEQDED